MAQVIRVQFGKGNEDAPCRICGKLFEEHSIEETEDCMKAELAQFADAVCKSCGRKFVEHSAKDNKACAQKQQREAGKC